MTDVHLIGRILPERQHFSLSGTRLYIKMPDRGVDACLIFGVMDNQVTAKFIGKLGDLSNYMLKNIASQAIQDILNAVAFTTGRLYELDLTGLLRDDERKTDGSSEFHYFDPSDEVVTARATTLTLQEIAAHFITDDGIPVRRCLNDLHMALKHHADSAFYCYRALETVRWHLGNKAGIIKDKQQWELLRGSLNVDRAKIEKVKSLADPLRHGVPVNFRGDAWREIIGITWDIVESYIRNLRSQVPVG